LYLTGHQRTDAKGPDMATLWPCAHHLRVLVLDVLQDLEQMASLHRLPLYCRKPTAHSIALLRWCLRGASMSLCMPACCKGLRHYSSAACKV
jgi:hypothetical protein